MTIQFSSSEAAENGNMLWFELWIVSWDTYDVINTFLLSEIQLKAGVLIISLGLLNITCWDDLAAF